MATKQQEREVTFEIIDSIGCLSISSTGWTKEVNIVSWNGAKPRLDIREWNPEHSKMSRGIGLNGEETKNLLALLQGTNLDSVGLS